MPTYKVTIHTKVPTRGAGASFSLYREDSSHAAAIAAGKDLATQFAKLIPKSTYVSKVATHREGSLRGNDGEAVTIFPALGRVPPQQETAYPWMGVRVYLKMTDRSPAIKILRPLDPALIDFPKGGAVPSGLTPEGKEVVNIFLAWIGSNDWQVKVHYTPNDDVQNPILTIVHNDEDDWYDVTYGGDPIGDLDEGDRVFILGEGIDKWPYLRGWQRVVAINGQTLRINACVDCETPVYGGGLRLFLEEFRYEDVIGFQQSGISRRKVGAPWDQPSGRRSNRRKCV